VLEANRHFEIKFGSLIVTSIPTPIHPLNSCTEIGLLKECGQNQIVTLWQVGDSAAKEIEKEIGASKISQSAASFIAAAVPCD
jgi:hypothetical protein